MLTNSSGTALGLVYVMACLFLEKREDPRAEGIDIAKTQIPMKLNPFVFGIPQV
jgi:hypothetical protein